jgi:hypothetical protein
LTGNFLSERIYAFEGNELMLDPTVYRQPIRAGLREVKYIGKLRRDMGRHMKDGPSSSEFRSIP